MWPNPQETCDLVILTEELLNGRLFCAVLISRTIQKELIFNSLLLLYISLPFSLCLLQESTKKLTDPDLFWC